MTHGQGSLCLTGHVKAQLSARDVMVHFPALKLEQLLPSACLVFQPELRLHPLCLRFSGGAAPALPR